MLKKVTKTQRQLQAEKMKQTLFESARDLLAETDYDAITIQDIVSRAGVSVGTFYLYFPSKQEVYYEVHHESDSYFIKYVVPNLKNKSTEEQIIFFFDVYAELFLHRVGLKMSKLLFTTKNKMFLRNDEDSLPALLESIMEKGILSGDLTTDMPANAAADYLLIIARGLTYNWCTHNGDYDLCVVMHCFIKKMLKAFLVAPDKAEAPVI